MTFGKKPTEGTERRKKEISKYGKPLNLESNRRFKRDNPETVKENWRSWASDETNKEFRKMYMRLRSQAKKNGYEAYFPKFVWVEWKYNQKEDPNSPLLQLDAKDYPPLRRNYD
tara:strand:- start:267 stop:608 length:342 start_codon:yes stop_codon:yes gene_type:complete